ncbi:MAG: hypothetical protein ACI9DC_005499, partial [Gammaproteobacteria bacterium]
MAILHSYEVTGPDPVVRAALRAERTQSRGRKCA